MWYNYRGSFVERLAPNWWDMSSVLEFENNQWGLGTEESIPGLLKILLIPSQLPVGATWLNVNIRVLQG
jgi:hypothetical protein